MSLLSPVLSLFLRPALLLVLLFLNGMAGASEVQPLTQAWLQTASGGRLVSLPHQLAKEDFAPEGGRVRYQLSLHLKDLPTEKWAIYVRKMSLAGRVWLNGRDVGMCELGALEEVRCLNLPHLFIPPLDYWRQGDNRIEFEIHASSRQLNGLSAVLVGDALTLDREHFGPAYFWVVDMLKVSMWLSLLLGFTALAVAYMIRDGALYLWVGLSSVAGGLAKVAILQTHPWISPAFFAWLAYSLRVMVVPLTLLAIVGFFKRDRMPAWLVALVPAYIAVALLLLWTTGVDLRMVSLAYTPGMVAVAFLLVLIVRWTWLQRRPSEIAIVLVVFALVAVGLGDWVRIRGGAGFDGVFLMPYAHSALTLVFGLVLLGMVGQALRRERQERLRLEGTVADRSRQLQVAQERISDMERTLLQLTENIPVGTFVLEADAQGLLRFTFVSDRYLNMLDLRREDLLADPGAGFRRVHPQDYPQFLAVCREAFARGKPLNWTGRVLVNRAERWIHLEVAPRRLSTGGTAWEGVVIDISDQKESERALKQAYESLTAIEVERSALEVRERMVQDMHDGLGSQLVSARLLAEQGSLDQQQLKELLQECMADLHLVVDTLGAKGKTLAEALADFRFRTQQRLAGQPLKMHWSEGLDELPELPERTILQILRIVQEAVANALKHAQAAHVWVDLSYLPEQRLLRASVTDDGVGLTAQPPQGRGMKNMTQRAREIGASVQLSPRGSGTQVMLELAL